MLCESIFSVTVLLGSIHFPDSQDSYQYNNVNPGVFLECDNGIIFGAAYNSFKKVSAFAGYHARYQILPSLSTGIIASACTGYRSPICAAGTIEYEKLTIAIVPKFFDIQHATVITFGINHRF